MGQLGTLLHEGEKQGEWGELFEMGLQGGGSRGLSEVVPLGLRRSPLAAAGRAPKPPLTDPHSSPFATEFRIVTGLLIAIGGFSN